jgi:hypothetical protein
LSKKGPTNGCTGSPINPAPGDLSIGRRDTEIELTIKDIFQVATWGVAAVGGVVSALLAVYQMRQNRRQREEELRWKGALQAKTLLDEVFKSPKASSALRMLDWSGRKYKNDDGDAFEIKKDELPSLLRTNNLLFGPKEAYVRDCFDELFSFIEMIEHYMSTSLIRFEDMKTPFDYYIKRIAADRQVFENFLSFYGYEGVLKFLNRFQVWGTLNK